MVDQTSKPSIPFHRDYHNYIFQTPLWMEIIVQVISKTTRETAAIMQKLNSITGKKIEATSR